MTSPARLPLDQLLSECVTRRTRRSGPGGQHRNKVETAVVIEHLPTATSAEASERRSQEQNHQVAIHRLRVKLAIDYRGQADDLPSEMWKNRIRGKRIAVNTEHEDFPVLLAELLDTIFAHGFNMSAAAEQLRVTSSQLTKLLKQEREAWAMVNRQRQTLGMPPLK
jgi:hypothetical protein